MKIIITVVVVIALIVGAVVWKPWKGSTNGTDTAGNNGIPSAAQAMENQIAELKAQLAAAKGQPAPQTVIVPAGAGQPGVVGQPQTVLVNGGRAVTSRTMVPTSNFGGHHNIEFKLTGARKDPKRVPGFEAWVRSFRDRANQMLVGGATREQVDAAMRSEYARFNIGGQPSLVIN